MKISFSFQQNPTAFFENCDLSASSDEPIGTSIASWTHLNSDPGDPGIPGEAQRLALFQPLVGH